MAYQDFFNGKRLTIADFSPSEISSISAICNPILDTLTANPKGISVNCRPTSWFISKAQLYICFIATKDINSPVFANVAAMSRILSGIDFLYDRNDQDWDKHNPVVTEQTRILQNTILSINALIAPKTFANLDNTVWDKHVEIKSQVETLSNTLESFTASYKRTIILDKADGHNAVGLDSAISPVAGLIALAYPPSAPFVAVFQGVVSLIQEFSKPDPALVASNQLALYENYKNSISAKTNELIAYKSRINDDGYDYDLVNMEVTPYVKPITSIPVATTPPPTPSTNSANLLGIDFTKPKTWIVILLFFVATLIIIRNRSMSQ